MGSTHPDVIDTFDGAHGYLSNFHRHPLTVNGRTYRSGEHAYQAAKATTRADHDRVAGAPTPGLAKRYGRDITLRPDWDTIAPHVMATVTAAKYADPDLAAALIRTGTRLLIEGTTWHDQRWGTCTCPVHDGQAGQNLLGRTLMTVRARLAGHPADTFTRVAVTGHRPSAFTPAQTTWLTATLPRVLDRLRTHHATTTAITGLAVGADTLFADAALTTGLDLWTYVPFPGQPNRWPPADQHRWHTLRAAAFRDVTLNPDPYTPQKVHARNDYLIRDADLIIAIHHPHRTTGGTATAIRKARAAGRPLLHVNPTSRAITRHNWPGGTP